MRRRSHSARVRIWRAWIRTLTAWIQFVIARGGQRCTLSQLEHADQNQQERHKYAPVHEICLMQKRNDAQQKQYGRAGKTANQYVAVHCVPPFESLTRRTISHAPRAIKTSGQRKWTTRSAKYPIWFSKRINPKPIRITAPIGSLRRQKRGGTGGTGGIAGSGNP